MADIDIRRAHRLGLKAARAAADEMAARLARRFDLKGEWDGDVLNFQRPGVTGSLAVGASDVRLSVSLGLLLRALKGSIEAAIHDELDKLFSAPPPAAPKPKKAPPRRKKAG